MLGGPTSLAQCPPSIAVPGIPALITLQPHRRVVDLTGGVRVERLLVAVAAATLTEASSIADTLGPEEAAVSQQSSSLRPSLRGPPLLPTLPAPRPGLPHCYRCRWHCLGDSHSCGLSNRAHTHTVPWSSVRGL